MGMNEEDIAAEVRRIVDGTDVPYLAAPPPLMVNIDATATCDWYREQGYDIEAAERATLDFIGRLKDLLA